MKHLVLFDIDHTLIKTPKAHIEAFRNAFRKLYKIEAMQKPEIYMGWTDKAIIKDIAKKHEIESCDVEKIMKNMVEIYPTLNKVNPPILLHGVKELLEALQKKGVIIGMVTANLEPIAYEKMKTFNLEKYFTVGGFGSDHTERGELAKIAIKRAEELGFNGKATHVGDTPADIAAGKYAGIRTLGVATGDSSMKELLACGADTVVRDLSETDVIMKILLGDDA